MIIPLTMNLLRFILFILVGSLFAADSIQSNAFIYVAVLIFAFIQLAKLAEKGFIILRNRKQKPRKENRLLTISIYEFYEWLVREGYIRDDVRK